MLSSHLCNYRRFPSVGCGSGSACNRLSGMCSQIAILKADIMQEPVTAASAPSSDSVTNRLVPEAGSPSKQLLVPKPTAVITHTATLQSTTYGATTQPTFLPDEDDNLNLTSHSSSFSFATAAIVFMGIVLVSLVACAGIYVLCRVLRRPVDVFSTSADLFEMTFLSNEW